MQLELWLILYITKQKSFSYGLEPPILKLNLLYLVQQQVRCKFRPDRSTFGRMAVEKLLSDLYNSRRPCLCGIAVNEKEDWYYDRRIARTTLWAVGKGECSTRSLY